MLKTGEHLGLAIARDRMNQAALRYADGGGRVHDEGAVLDAALAYGRVLRLVSEQERVVKEMADAEAARPVAVIIDGQRFPFGKEEA